MRLVLLVAAGCAHPARVPECDDLVGLTEQLAKCPKIPADSRAKIAAVRAKLDELLEGTSASVQDGLPRTCRAQREALAQAYAQFAPNCLK